MNPFHTKQPAAQRYYIGKDFQFSRGRNLFSLDKILNTIFCRYFQYTGLVCILKFAKIQCCHTCNNCFCSHLAADINASPWSSVRQ